MCSFWRLLVLCLMAVALPVQGYAAAGAVHCAAMHERMQAAASHHPLTDAADPHHAGHAAHDRHGMAADHHEADHTASTCSACAACCAALALPAPAVVLAPMKADEARPAPPVGAMIAFLTGGPERPPRIDLA